MNPAILEDLNSRGLFTSQTARDAEQGRLLQQIALQNQGEFEDLRRSALSSELQGEQDALDSGLDLRRGGL